MNARNPDFARTALTVVAAALLLCACGGVRRPVAPAVPDPSPAPPAADAGSVHVVAAGETLWRIARAYGVELDELARANDIDDPERISAGVTLRIPGVAVRASRAIVWPIVGGELLSGFGAKRRNHRHAGVDIRGRHGEPVLAAAAGRVVYSGSGMRGYGKTVIVDHGDGLTTLYAHNSALVARVGQRIDRGETIARVGRTGNATTEHCHFELRRNDVPLDPMPWFDRPVGRLR